VASTPTPFILAAAFTALLVLGAVFVEAPPGRPAGFTAVVAVVMILATRTRALTAALVGGLAWLFYLGFVVNGAVPGGGGDLTVRGRWDVVALPALVGAAVVVALAARRRARRVMTARESPRAPAVPRPRSGRHDQRIR
jgi:hypothetical protein